MKHITPSKDLHISTGVEQAREFIKEYIGENLRNLSISHSGRRIYADIYYVDFKPEREVRRYIEDAIPNIYIEEIERDYSDENVTAALMESNLTIYIKEEDGCLRPTTPRDLIYELMQHVDFTTDIISKIETEEEFRQFAEEADRLNQQQQEDGVFSRKGVSK